MNKFIKVLLITLAVLITASIYMESAIAGVIKEGSGVEYFKFDSVGNYQVSTYIAKGSFKSLGLVSYDGRTYTPLTVSALDTGGGYFVSNLAVTGNLDLIYGMYVIDFQGNKFTSYDSSNTNSSNFTGLHHVDTQYYLYGNSNTRNSLVSTVTHTGPISVPEPNTVILMIFALFAIAVLAKSTSQKV